MLDDLMDPTATDLVEAEVSDDAEVWVDDDDDFDYAATDDRWNDAGIPKWSAWA